MGLNKDLLQILACPKCKKEVHLNDAGDGLICNNCKLLYPIQDEIPIMMIEEAKKLD